MSRGRGSIEPSVRQGLSPAVVLAYASSIVPQGQRWVSGREADEYPRLRSSASYVYSAVREGEELSAEDRKRGADAYLWLMSQDPEDSDYLRKLQEIGSREVVDESSIGIFASAISAYAREVMWKPERNEHLSHPGLKLGSAEAVYKGYSHYDTRYGAMYTHLFHFPDGHHVVWKTSKYLELEPGEKAIITGKVKEHETTRDGYCLTVLTRCQVKSAGGSN
jgi:hypothetical protein